MHRFPADALEAASGAPQITQGDAVVERRSSSEGADGFNCYSGRPDDRTGELLSVPAGEQFWIEGPYMHGTPAGIDLLRANTWTRINEASSARGDVRLRYGGRPRHTSTL